MTSGPRQAIVWLVAIVILALVSAAAARRGGGGRARGGLSSRGPASSGSLGQRGHGTRGGYNARGPAASGSFGGSERREARQDTRDTRRDERHTQREERRDEAHETWQGYAGDDYDDPYYGSDYHGEYYDADGYELAGTAAAVATGVAIGAAAATAAPPYWTLSCVPTQVVAGTTTYYRCGTTWYIQVYSDDEIAYTIVNPPAGY